MSVPLPAGWRIDRATVADVPAIVALLTDDALGRGRETADLSPYLDAFERIDADPAHLLAVVRSVDDIVVGTFHLTVLPGLARGAVTRLQIEAVRTAASVRGTGVGAAMFAWAHEWGRERGATLAQLTSDKSRHDAHRFYGRLGYVASHEGYKRPL